MTLEELIEEEKKLLALLNQNKEKQKAFFCEEFSKKMGFTVGDTIQWKDGKIFKGVVTKFEFVGTKPKDVFAQLIKSNGELGKKEVKVWISFSKNIKKI